MKWRPYPKYKPSGVEWLGDVPEHWEVKSSDFFVTTMRHQIEPAIPEMGEHPEIALNQGG